MPPPDGPACFLRTFATGSLPAEAQGRFFRYCMKEIERILTIYEGLAGQKVALATVLHVQGSSYRRPGARMLITDDGRWEGAISGGCLEGDALRKARQVMSTQTAMLVRYDTMDDEANSLGVGLGCNGIIDVLIEPIDTAAAHNPLTVLRQAAEQQQRCVLATVFRSDNPRLPTGTRFLAAENQPAPAPLEADMAVVMQTGKPLLQPYAFSEGTVEVFLERLEPSLQLVLFGAGYDTLPLARLADAMGWKLTVTEDCIAHLAPRRFPQATCLLHANADTVLEKLTLTDRTAAVLMSHNYHYDFEVLTRLLKGPVPYIGLLGPRKRYEKMQAAWAENGPRFSEATLGRVHSPIGLDVGAETPDEIALSIVAEIQAFFTGKKGGFLREKSGPIHERSATPGVLFS